MESLRVQILSPRHPSDVSTGVAHVAASVASLWARQGHQVRLCFPKGASGPNGPRSGRWEGVEVVPMEVHPRAHVPKSLEAETARRFAEEAARGLDVVLANNEYGAFLPSRREGGPLAVVVLHGLAVRFMELERATRRGLRPRAGFYADLRAVRQLERRAIEGADRVVAISRRVLEDAEHVYGVPSGKGRVIYNGTDPVRPAAPEEARAARAALGLAEGDRVAVLVGADAYRKGFDVAGAAMDRLRKEGSHLRLLVIGRDGRSRDGVRYLGRVSEERKREVLLAGDVLLMPSRYEGFPGIAQEAAALGLPVIASRQSGLDTGRSGEDFLEVGSLEPADWARAVASVVEDPRRRGELSERGARLLSQRTWEAMARDYLAMVREALAEPPAAPSRR